MGLRSLAKGHKSALRTVHYETIVAGIDVNVHLFALGIVECETALGAFSGRDVEFELKSVFRRYQHVAQVVFLGDGELAEGNRVFAQGTYFGRDVGRYVKVSVVAIKTELARQTVGTSVLLDGRYIGILPIAHPRQGDHALTGVGESDRGIVIFAEIEPFHLRRRSIALEFLAIKLTDEVFCGTSPKQTAGIDVDDHDILLFSVDSEGEKVRTLELVGLRSVATAERTDVIPFFQVGRTVKAHLFVGRYDHVPCFRGFVPENFGVAEIFQAIERTENGISFIFREGAPVVRAVSHALQLPVLVARGSIESHNRILTIARAVVEVDDRAAGENVAERVARKGGIQFCPVEKVLTHRVSPVHVPPFRSIRVVLIIKMVLSVFIHHAVGVVHPTVRRRMVIKWTIIVGILGIPLVDKLQVAERNGLRRDVCEAHHSFFAFGQTKRHIIVGGELRQADIHPRIGGFSGVQEHFYFAPLFFDRKE